MDQHPNSGLGGGLSILLGTAGGGWLITRQFVKLRPGLPFYVVAQYPRPGRRISFVRFDLLSSPRYEQLKSLRYERRELIVSLSAEDVKGQVLGVPSASRNSATLATTDASPNIMLPQYTDFGNQFVAHHRLTMPEFGPTVLG
jgi:hypothetical protein